MSAGVEPATVRKSGQTGAEEDSAAAVEEMPRDMAAALPDETIVEMRTPKFRRMRYTWRPEERAVMDEVHSEIDRIIGIAFGDAFVMLNEIYDIIREPELVEGEIQRDRNGLVIWRRNAYGQYVEDFTQMTRAQRSDFFGRITVALFRWEQEAATIRGVALFSKAQFEERYAIAYDAPEGRHTVEARQAAANADAADERYHAVFRTMVSHKADAVVRSMERLCQRLKDSLVTD